MKTISRFLIISLSLVLLLAVPVKADLTSQINDAEEALGIDNSDKKAIERVELLEIELGLAAGEASLSERVSAIENEIGIGKEEPEMEVIPEEEKLAVAPSDEYVMERLGFIDSIVEMAAVTEDHDPNENLNKAGGYIGCIYFEDSQVDQSQFYFYESDDVIDIGTEGGGAVEIYPDLQTAKMRDEYLGSIDLTGISTGSHKVVGTCVIRTSYHLTATQQNELTELITKVLTEEDIEILEADTKKLITDVEYVEEITEADTESNAYELYNQDGYIITCLGYERNNRMKQADLLKLRIQNLTHYDVNIMDSGSYINGSMVRIGAYFSIASGKEQTEEVMINDFMLEEAGIETVEDITLNFTVSDSNTYYDLASIGPLDISIDESGNVVEKVIYRDPETIKEVQTLLNALGYNCGNIDGSAGKKTNSMILQFERDHGLKEDTYITPELLEALRNAVQ